MYTQNQKLALCPLFTTMPKLELLCGVIKMRQERNVGIKEGGIELICLISSWSM